jgi:hypothetical protein
MQIVLSSSVSGDDIKIINSAISAIFTTKNQDINSFDPQRSLVISNNSEEKADFYFNTESFPNDNASYKMIQLKNLAYTIFSEYVDPRVIIANYKYEAPIVTESATVIVANNHLEELKKLESEIQFIEKEIQSEVIPESSQHINNLPTNV